MSWLSSLVPISLTNHQDLMEQWLACLIHNLRIHGSSPSTAKSNLMNRAILMSPNRTKHCVYGHIYYKYIHRLLKLIRMMAQFISFLFLLLTGLEPVKPWITNQWFYINLQVNFLFKRFLHIPFPLKSFAVLSWIMKN